MLVVEGLCVNGIVPPTHGEDGAVGLGTETGGTKEEWRGRGGGGRERERNMIKQNKLPSR